jgi:hypothetical protein
MDEDVDDDDDDDDDDEINKDVQGVAPTHRLECVMVNCIAHKCIAGNSIT